MARELSWSEVLSLMTPAGGKGAGRKCNIRLLDTLFVPNDTSAPQWYFTTKSGSISRKKGEKAALSGVFDRFSKFALANPNNKERTIGVFVHGNGYRQQLSESSLAEIVDQNSSVLMQPGSHLQVFLRPCQGRQEMVTVSVKQTQEEGKVTYDFDYFLSANMGKTKIPLTNEKVKEQVRSFAKELLVHAQECRQMTATSMTIDFVMDDNEHVWLSNVQNCAVVPLQESETVTYAFDGGNDENQENGETKIRSPLPVVKGSMGASDALSSSAVNEDPLVGNGGLLYKVDDGAYCCALGPDDLPGLRAWALVSLSDGDNLQWSIDMKECDQANPNDANPAMESVKKQRTEQRHRISATLVALMSGSEELLLGFHNSVNNKDETNFKAAWQNALVGARMKADSSEEVVVCGNTHAVCRKLESLCNINFEPMTKLSVSPKKNRPRSEESNPRGLGSAGDMNGVQQLRILSAGGGDAPFDEDEGVEPPQAIENPFFEGGEMEAIPLNKLPKGSKMKGTVAKKPKKGGAKAGAFRRDGGSDMNAAPNIELIAKFAAEKERVQRDARAKRQEQQRQQSILAVESSDPLFDEDEEGSMGQEWPERITHPIKGNKKAKKGTKKGIKSGSGGGGQPPNFRSDEEKYAYYEKMASSTGQRQGPGFQDTWGNGGYSNVNPGGYDPTGSIGSLTMGSMMSGSEADFMVRQAQQGDVESTLPTGQPLGFEGPNGGFAGGDSVGSAGSLAVVGQVDSALRDRVVDLTKQLESSVSANHRKDTEIELLSEKLRRTLSDLDASRRHFEVELRKKEDEADMKILDLKEKHANHMATIANAPPSSDTSTGNGAAGGMDDPNSASFQGNKQLMDQLEALRKENRRLEQSATIERQRTLDESSSKLMMQERNLKAEILDMRSRIGYLEDENQRVKDDASQFRAKADSLDAVNRQLQTARDDAIENQNRLRADLKNMQQSVNASYRLESEQELAVGADADTQIRLNEAKFEARTRQLLNKVEFLKAQLAAEQSSSEEMRSQIASNRAKVDEMRDDFRSRLQEVEKEKQAAVEDAERRVESQYDSRMNELTTLQTKMKMMQGQLQDAFSDSTLLKQREEAAKAAAAKASSTQSILRAEIEQLRTQLVEAREEKDDLMMQTGSKQANDATIRRLDNERQYLKSQLASEITHKNEMQNALAKNQHQLNEVNKQWKADVASLMEKAQQSNQDAIAKEQALVQKNITLDADVRRLEGTNSELKEGFAKMREQVRMEQLSLENATSVNRRLQEQYEITKSELARLQDSEDNTAKNHFQQMKALQDTMDENDGRRVAEINALKDELSKQYLANSDAQKQTMALRSDFRSVRQQDSKLQGASKISGVLRKWRLNRAAMALRVWSTNSTLVGVAGQFRGHVNELMDKTIAEQREIKENALSQLQTEMQKVQDARVAELNAEFDVRTEEITIAYDQEKSAAIDEAHEEMKAHVEQLEREWTARVDQTLAMGKDDLARAANENEVKMQEFSSRCTADLNRGLEEASRKVEAAQTATEMSDQLVARLKTQLSEFEKSHNDAMVELMAEHTNKEKARIREGKVSQEELKAALAEEKKKALDDASAQFFEEMEALKSKMQSERDEAEEALKSQYEDFNEAERQKQHTENEDRLRMLRQEWEDDKTAALELRDEENKSLLETKMEEYAKSVEAERVRAVKLESSKWRQALKDAEHRFELEISKAKAEGRSEQKAEMKEDMTALEHSRQMSLQRMQSQMEDKLKALQHEHDEATEKELHRQEMLREEAIRDEARKTKERLDEEYAEDLKKRIEEAWKDSGDMWQKKLTKEENRLQDFKKDVALQSQQLAKERNDLQERVNQSDEIIKRMEALNRAEINRIEKDREAEREMQELKFGKAKKHAIRDLEREQNEAMEAVEAKYKEIAERRIVVERTKLEEDMNLQIHQLQTESEGLITGLESAVAELKAEKDALSKDLYQTSSKLEDTEDSLYDLQTKTKRNQKDNSITLWRQVMSQQKMKKKYESHMDDMEQDFENREKKLAEEMANEQNEMILAALKLASLLGDIEDQRKKIHRTLTQFRTEELMEKRTLIRVLEKDFERLTMEKDSLEEQRDLMEEEIEDMEGNVRSLEDEIREHNRTSSMQNGRINVAHARKKRRLDGELERMLETIEQRRINMGEMDERAADKARERDNKEAEMVDLEKQVVGILVEQQRKVLKGVEEMKGTAEDKCHLVLSVARLPWPPPDAPTIEDVMQMQKARQMGKPKKEDSDDD